MMRYSLIFPMGIQTTMINSSLVNLWLTGTFPTHFKNSITTHCAPGYK